MLTGLASIMVTQWAYVLTFATSRFVRPCVVEFEEAEKPALDAAMNGCIETYFPEGWTKHLPLLALLTISGGAVSRALDKAKDKDNEKEPDRSNPGEERKRQV